MRQKPSFLFSLLLALVFVSCVEEPASIAWLTNNRIPLVNTVYTAQRLIEESRDANFVIAADGTIDYVITERRERMVDIRDSLRVSLSRTLSLQSAAAVGTPVIQNDSLQIVGGKVEKIDSVALKRGFQKIVAQNLNASRGTLTVTFPTIRNRANGQALVVSTPFSPNSTDSAISPSLAGYFITSPTRTSVPISIQTTLSQGSQINLRLTVQSDSFLARYVKGVIWDIESNKPPEYDIVVDPFDIDAFNSIDTVIGDADPVIAMRLFNYFNVEDTAKPIFRSINARRADTLLIREQNRDIVRFVPATPEGATLTQPSIQVVLDKTNSNALPVVLRLPNKIITDGKVLVNPRRLTGSAFDTSTVALDLEIKIPLRFSLDTLAASDSSDISEEINVDNLEKAVFNLRVENEIPFNAEGKIWFLDANRQPLRLANGAPFTFPRQGSAERLRFGSAPINPSTGFSAGATTTNLRLDFTFEELRLLKRAKFAFNQLFVNTKTPTPRRVVMRNADKIRIRGFCEIQYRIGN